MSTEPEGACLVCGEMTKTRCSSCRKAGIDLHFCSPEHLRLVRLEGAQDLLRPRQSPPALTADEAAEAQRRACTEMAIEQSLWRYETGEYEPTGAASVPTVEFYEQAYGLPRGGFIQTALPTMRSLSTYSGADKHEWHIRMIALRRFVHGNRPRGQRDLSRKASACVAATLERDVALTKNRDCIFEPVVSALRHRLVILAELLALSTLPSPPLAFDPDLIQSSLRQLLAFVAPFVHISDPYAAAAYSRQIKSQWLQRDEMCLDELWNDAYFLLSESDRERVEREQGGGVTE